MEKTSEKERIIMKPCWTDTLRSFSINEKREFTNQELRVDMMRCYCTQQRKRGISFEVNENSNKDTYTVTRKK